MDDRQGDLTIPLISAIFCLSVISGGLLICLWLLNQIDGNWVPITALILTGIPWLFWFFIYIYAITKYFLVYRFDEKKNANRQSRPPPPPGPSAAGASSEKKSEVAMEEGRGNRDVSVASSKECELPLTLSAAS